MRVIIAEKPSYAKTIVNALEHIGEHFTRRDGYFESINYYVTWQFGHLFRLYTIEEYINSEDKRWKENILPYIPKQFKFRLKDDNGAKKQYQVIRKLINDKKVTEIVESGDADSEGNLLVTLVVSDVFRRDNLNKKRTRLWSSDQSETTIIESLNNLKDVNFYRNYSNEAYTRTCMDFLLGINLTRKFSLMNNRLTGARDIFSIGRCNTSIVDIIYERDMEIKNFIPVQYWQLESEEETKGEIVKLIDKDKFELVKEVKAKELAEHLNSCKAIVENVEEKLITKTAPKLFSLPSVQGILSDRYKISLGDSLKAIQSLYEAGYVTYPRTNSEYLSEDEVGKVRGIINKLNREGYNLKLKESKAIFNNAMVESHSALIITSKLPPKGSLNKTEEIVYNTIKNRFISKFLDEETKISQTIITITVGNRQYQLKGEVIKEKGFYNFEPLPKSKETITLPNLKKGDIVNIDFKPIKKETKPPSKLNLKTLIKMLENPFRKEYKTDEEAFKDVLEGIEIGTPATRTGIIENTKKYGYIIESKGTLSITDKGIYLIETLRRLNIDISKNRTVEFSKILKKVFRNELAPLAAVDIIKSELNEMFDSIQETKIEGFASDNKEKEVLGICPRCKKHNIVEGPKNFYCEGYKANPKCEFALWKENPFFKSKGKKLSKAIAKRLIKEGKAHVRGLRKKDNSGVYDADIILDDTGKYVNFKLSFENNKKK
ncbi:DNA topoisomerase [Clostridium perfringens]|uniref:DNA topoisomerase n=1 Tax=Clostridium perfringens E str. JGS1987 TaxID=451755 RepID=B1BR51_CLOPF|nr:DNA topoisomerase [Clostridium perfringens]EDT15860.1 type I topoisomease [Clostridium perfringens E str. JGS1987]MCX0407813.1 DNA topoisomerase III [Clostridium perfringens]